MVVKSLKDGGKLELGDVLWWTPDGRFWFFTRQAWQSITDVYLVPSPNPTYAARLQAASFHPAARGVLNISGNTFNPEELKRISVLEGFYVGTGECTRYENEALFLCSSACMQVLDELGAVLLSRDINAQFRANLVK